VAEPLTVALPLVGPLAAISLSAALLGMARREARGASSLRPGSRLAAWTAGAALACSAFGALPALFVDAALRDRTYLETLERVLPRARVYVVEGGGGTKLRLVHPGGGGK
jgi:hypothetical protein